MDLARLECQRWRSTSDRSTTSAVLRKSSMTMCFSWRVLPLRFLRSNSLKFIRKMHTKCGDQLERSLHHTTPARRHVAACPRKTTTFELCSCKNLGLSILWRVSSTDTSQLHALSDSALCCLTTHARILTHTCILMHLCARCNTYT